MTAIAVSFSNIAFSRYQQTSSFIRPTSIATYADGETHRSPRDFANDWHAPSPRLFTSSTDPAPSAHVAMELDVVMVTTKAVRFENDNQGTLPFASNTGPTSMARLQP
ncbi:hypothetical protein FRC01_010457, partial [Tulasnella sp. 417]